MCYIESVKTALRSLVTYIEGALEYNEFSLVAFLDIESAFDNVKPEALINALERLHIQQPIIRR